MLRTGWLPAAAVTLLAGAAVHRGAGIAVVDLVVFAGYVVGWLTLPGTLLWRAATRSRGPRPLAEDLAFGTLVGFVAEFPAYLLCLAAGFPLLYLGWPVLALLATLTHARGRELWRRTRQPMPLWWSWGVAAFLTYAVVWFSHYIWGTRPVTAANLRSGYVDEPYHLSLATGLKHFWPPRVTFVEDTDLQYHWLSHLHVAASSWVTGIEPIALLRALSLPTLALVVFLALAHAAVRLTGAAWTGPVAAGGLVVAPLNFSGWSDGSGEGILSGRIIASPSAGFVMAALLLGVVLSIELIRRDLRGRAPWLLLALVMAGMVGAKSTALPTVLAGLVAAAALAWLVHRRPDRVVLGLALLAGVVFVLAKQFFFGSGTHGMEIDPLALTSERQTLDRGQSALNAIWFLGYVSWGAGLLAWLLRGGHRRPEIVFLTVLCLSGMVAGLTFHQYAHGEFYFVYVVTVPMILGGVLGLHHLVQDLPVTTARSGTAVVLGAAVVAGLLFIGQTGPADPAGLTGWDRVLRLSVEPMVSVLALAALLTFVVRRVAARALPVGLVAVIVLAGLGTAPAWARLPDLVTDPVGNPVAGPGGVQPIALGGLQAARWVRAHSDVDDIVATNVHCERPRGPRCVPRSFWLAAYAERQVLVQGWSYVAWEAAGLHSPADYNPVVGPFWDPARLADNDAAFTDPSPGTLDRLAATYDVRWLVVDRRAPVDLAALESLAELRFRSGAYSVFELDR